MNWTMWVHEPGLAPFQNFSTPELVESQQLASAYIAGKGQVTPSTASDYNHWYSSLRVVFVQELMNSKDQVDIAILQKIDADLGITHTLDPEVKSNWFPLGIIKNYDIVTEPAHQFICQVGRLKYLKPIYQAMINAGKKTTAIQWFNENINFYHPYTIGVLGKLLGVSRPEVHAALKSPLVNKWMEQYNPLRGHVLPEMEEWVPEELLFMQE